MARQKIAFTVFSLLVLVAMTSVATLYLAPGAVNRLAYAVELGKSDAAREQLQTANDLSQAFRAVAKSMRPSVVSISSVRRVTTQPPRTPFAGELPSEMERFFGDELDGFFFRRMPRSPRSFEQRGLGTGVIVSEDGYIVTNNHVVAEADEVKVTLSDERQFTARVVGVDKPTDLAVLKIDGDRLQPAKWGRSTSLEVGDWVLAIGSPFGLDQTVTAGIISATGRANVGITEYEDFIQTDAAINPGNSGGPLVNLQGEVIGINTAIASRNGGSMGVGFAIPSAMATSVMDKLIEYGAVRRGYLGVMIQDLDSDLAASFGYDGEGVLIGDVVEDGPADEAGLQRGDIVTRFEGNSLTDANQLRNLVAATAVGSKATLKIFRDGETRTVRVTIGELPSDDFTASPLDDSIERSLGLQVQTLAPDAARQLGYEAPVRGAVVVRVERGSIASAAGLRSRDVIIQVDSQTITNADDFSEAMQNSDLSRGVRLVVWRDGTSRFVFLRKD